MNTISLKCTGCGASLDITPDLDVFSCGYCNSRQMVRRAGGTVSLKPLEEAVTRVQHGTDRTAAELAVRRLREELSAADAALKKFRQDYWSKHRSENSTPSILILVGGFFFAAVASTAAPIAGAITLFGTMVAISVYLSIRSARARARFPEIEHPLLRQRSQIQKALKNQLEFLNSPSA